MYGLRLAISGWTKTETAITTAISQDLYGGFYFRGVDQQFKTLAEAYLGIVIATELIQISLPQVYRHRPLYNLPLYHELGHFLDVHHSITPYTFMLSDATSLLPSLPAGLPKDTLHNIHINHRMEYFADLFGASFTGLAYGDFLQAFAGANSISLTHPATSDRLTVIDDFLNGKSNPIVELFCTALSNLKLPELKAQFSAPDLNESFDNVRPYLIQSDAEAHGILDSGWHYLQTAWTSPTGLWAEMDEAKIEQTVNDLIEKSTRNRMIVTKWGGGK